MKLVLILILIIPFTATANISGVYDIWPPEKLNGPYLVLATNGRVHEASAKNESLIQTLQKAKDSKLFVRFEFFEEENDLQEVKKRMIVKKAVILQGRYDEDIKLSDPDPEENEGTYTVNRLSKEEAKKYFVTMRTGMREKSQCYNRAHVWTYELHKFHNIGTMKNWMFFTRRYIREYNFYWWFHVTPYTIVPEAGQVALDRRYMSDPTPIVEWKNYFMRNKASCPIITRYSSYRNNQESEYCYWIQTNMYFWQPYQIERLEEGYDPRWGWKKSELDIAYGDAL